MDVFEYLHLATEDRSKNVTEVGCGKKNRGDVELESDF